MLQGVVEEPGTVRAVRHEGRGAVAKMLVRFLTKRDASTDARCAVYPAESIRVDATTLKECPVAQRMAVCQTGNIVAALVLFEAHHSLFNGLVLVRRCGTAAARC